MDSSSEVTAESLRGPFKFVYSPAGFINTFSVPCNSHGIKASDGQISKVVRYENWEN